MLNNLKFPRRPSPDARRKRGRLAAGGLHRAHPLGPGVLRREADPVDDARPRAGQAAQQVGRAIPSKSK